MCCYRFYCVFCFHVTNFEALLISKIHENMKTLFFILLGGLFLLQPTFAHASVTINKNESTAATADKKPRKPASIHLLKRDRVTRSVLMIPGYIEDNQLYVCFDDPVENEYIVVTDMESGKLVYSGTFTGSVLVISLTDLGESYTIEIV